MSIIHLSLSVTVLLQKIIMSMISLSLRIVIVLQKILDQLFTELPQSILQRFVQRHGIDHFLRLGVIVPALDARLGLESVHRGAEKEPGQCALGGGPKDGALEPREKMHQQRGGLTLGQDFGKNLGRRGARMKGVDINVAAV